MKNVLGFLRALLSRRDGVYLLSLLVPLLLYNLALKAWRIAALPGEAGPGEIGLMWSDMFFNLGYALLWIGLFAAARRGPLRPAVVVLFHVTTIFMTIVVTCAHVYFMMTGTTLDYATLAEWVPKFNEIEPLLFKGGVSLSAWMWLAAALFYATLGPWLVTRAIEWWRGRADTPLFGTAESSSLGPLGLWLLALGFCSLSLLTGPGSTSAGKGKSFARDPFVNLVLTGAEEAKENSRHPDASAADPVDMPADASLVQTPRTEKQNVVLIHLESTRAESVTPYNEDLKTTPFMDELAKSSLVAKRSYVVVPSSSRATVTANCGVDPPLYKSGPQFWNTVEYGPGGVPVQCLANLLKDQGYSTGFFQSSSSTMDTFGGVAKNLGYEEHYSSETMDKEDFKEVYFIGHEDDIMLKPSEKWLEKHKDKPFIVEYLTSAGHSEYQCLDTRYGTEDFAEEEELNRYLNCMRLQDIFLKNLFDQYKRLGLYEDTIFVIFGDHGQGFGEHGRFFHHDTIYEEGIRVPLLIHAPGWFENGERVEGLSNQTDVLPTVLEMLGFEVKNGEYPGYSLLRPLPESRTLMFSCSNNRKCLASIKGNEKYIYHFGEQPEEFFDLFKDPLEKHNLASERSEEELDERREELLAWRSQLKALYSR